jgi:hypothetical protein
MLRIMFQISAGRRCSCLHSLPDSDVSKTGYYIMTILEKCNENLYNYLLPLSVQPNDQNVARMLYEKFSQCIQSMCQQIIFLYLNSIMVLRKE